MCTLKKRCLEKQNSCAQTQTRIYTDENSENGVYFRNGVEKKNRCWEKLNPCWKLTPMQSVLIFKSVCIPSPMWHEQAPPMIDAITEGLLQNDSFETMVANDYTASSVLRMETVRILWYWSTMRFEMQSEYANALSGLGYAQNVWPQVNISLICLSISKSVRTNWLTYVPVFSV